MVLGIRSNKLWGSIGISRRKDLMDKPIQYNSLYELIQEFNVSYKNNYHTLLACYIGSSFPTDYRSDEPVKWRAIKVKIYDNSSQNIEFVLNEYQSIMNLL